MKLLKLRLTDYSGYSGSHDIDLSEVSTCVIVGENGAGKSSILEAVLYALFGESRAATEDELSHGWDKHTGWAVDSFGVSLLFEMDGKQYLITRMRTPKKGTLTFDNETDGKSYTANGIRETQEVIHKIIGMEYDSFVSSVMLKQDDYDEFMKMSPSEAKEVLLEILGLDSFEDKRALAADKANKAKASAENLTASIEGYKAELKELDTVPLRIHQVELQLAEVNVQMNDAKTKVETAQKDHTQMKAECDAVHSAYESLEKIKRESSNAYAVKGSTENEFERSLSKCGLSATDVLSRDMNNETRIAAIHKVDLDKSTAALEVLNKQFYDVSGELKFLSSKGKELGDRKNAASGKSLCLLGKPECHAELVKTIEDDYNKVYQAAVEIRAKYDALQAQVEEQRKIKASSEVGWMTSSSILVCLAVYEKMKAASLAFDNIQKEIERLTEATRSGAVTLDDVRAKELELAGLKMRLERLQGNSNELLQELGGLKKSLSIREDTEEKMRRAMVEADKFRIDISTYSLLARAFSKEGIPALMIENIIPVLESDANSMLERLSDGRIKLQFVLQKKLKGGGLAESFEIYVTDENGTRSIQTYSGGEKYRIIFAVHSAFSKYLTYRSGAKIGFLAIDEPAGLDETGINRLVETLGVLRENYSQIFVITHLKELMDYFPQTILVEKVAGSSKVTTKAKTAAEKYL